MSNLQENIKAAQIDLIKELGIDQLEQAQKEEILHQIGEILQQRIVLRIIEELPEEKQDEFKGILEQAQETPEKLDEYLKANVPNVEDLILAEIGEYKKGASDFMKQTLNDSGVGGSEAPKTEKPKESESPKAPVEDLVKEPVSEIEKEQAEQEEKILEENKVEENQEKVEELDISGELEKTKTEDK